jgi:hypothetical protein
MAEQIVRCPYCTLGDQSASTLQRPAWFICEQCGHIVIPEDPDFKCACRDCLWLFWFFSYDSVLARWMFPPGSRTSWR